MYSNKLFVKDDLKYNHWVGHYVINPVYAVAFQKRKETIERLDESSENFEMEILDEGALDKVPTIPEKQNIINNPGRQYMRLLTIINFNNMM